MPVETPKDLLIKIQNVIDYISKNREWLFSGVGVLIVSWIIAIASRLYHWPALRSSGNEVNNSTERPNQDLILNSGRVPEIEEGIQNKAHYPRHRINFYYEWPPDPALTEDEVKFLQVFSSLPRRAITRGYRLDYLYDLLRSKGISPATSHVFVHNLYFKGYLKKHTTERQTEYYALSDEAIQYLVANGYVGLDHALSDEREPSSDGGRGLS